jgi:hypothetical protein
MTREANSPAVGSVSGGRGAKPLFSGMTNLGLGLGVRVRVRGEG